MVKMRGTKNEHFNILKKCMWIKLEYSILFMFKYGILLAGEMNEYAWSTTASFYHTLFLSLSVSC